MTDKETIKQAIKEARAEERRERNQFRATREMLGTTVGLFGGLGAIAGGLHIFVPQTITLFLAGAGLLCAGLSIWGFTGSGNSLRSAFLKTLLITALCFVVTFGVTWYFMVYLRNSGQPLINFDFMK